MKVQENNTVLDEQHSNPGNYEGVRVESPNRSMENAKEVK
jgi:hypothetical protein